MVSGLLCCRVVALANGASGNAEGPLRGFCVLENLQVLVVCEGAFAVQSPSWCCNGAVCKHTRVDAPLGAYDSVTLSNTESTV